MIMKQRIEELAAIMFGAKPTRLLQRAGGEACPSMTPLVSIHIPACREPPEMLRQTLDSVAKLDWPNFECVVVINNTPDPVMWEPIEHHCQTLGARFKFVRADRLQGFKAGALRLALDHTAPEAEIIGVLDADYVVHAGLAEGPRSRFRRSRRGPGAGTAGPSRRAIETFRKR